MVWVCLPGYSGAVWAGWGRPTPLNAGGPSGWGGDFHPPQPPRWCGPCGVVVGFPPPSPRVGRALGCASPPFLWTVPRGPGGCAPSPLSMPVDKGLGLSVLRSGARRGLAPTSAQGPGKEAWSWHYTAPPPPQPGSVERGFGHHVRVAPSPRLTA